MGLRRALPRNGIMGGWSSGTPSTTGRSSRTASAIPAAAVRVLVVGDVHGNERAGERIVARLRRVRTPHGVRLWLVRTANPDGVAAGTRQDARGVDLNRNFPWDWRPGARGTYYPGPRRRRSPRPAR